MHTVPESKRTMDYLPSNHPASGAALRDRVYAEYDAATQQLVVANYDGGTISVINVPLDIYGNDSNTYANPTCIGDGSTTSTYAGCGAVTGGFGTVTTIPVGNTATPNPASVTVLHDGSKAYAANQNEGTVTVVNLSTYTVEKTLTVEGHPRTVVNTQNSEFAKIYVASPDSPYITIIESSPTVTDLVDTTVLVEGLPVDVRVTTQSGAAAGNSNYSSRVPGYGQPCNLPGSASLGSRWQPARPFRSPEAGRGATAMPCKLRPKIQRIQGKMRPRFTTFRAGPCSQP